MLVVTADELPRLMACNGSRLMDGQELSIDRPDIVRDEGNAAHWLCKEVHQGNFFAEELIDRKAENGVYITPDMLEYLEEYLAGLVLPGTLVEYDTTFNTGLAQINARTDRARYDEEHKTLYIDDLKYGWSIVEPEMNWTLIAHALGFMFKNPDKDIQQVVMTIFQPRPYHYKGRVRSWQINRATLEEFYNQLVATLANPTDQLNTGQHCYRCPALATCPAARKAQMNAVDASETVFNEEIDNDRLAFELDHLQRAIEVLKQRQKAYQELALHRLRQGEIIENYAVDNELTNRQWQSHVTPEFLKMMTGKDLVKTQLITPAQAEKAGANKEVVAALTERRNKGVKLVRIDADAKAQKMFNEKGK